MANFNVTFISVQQSYQSPPNVIYTSDDPTKDDLLEVTLDWLSDAPSILVLNKSDKDASQTSYHFSFNFRSGYLVNPGSIAVAPVSADEWDIYVHDGKQGLVIYCLSKGGLDLVPGQACSVTLQNVGSQATVGTHHVSVPFSFNANLVWGAQPPNLSHLPFMVTFEPFTKEQGSAPSPPLAVGFDTTNMVLCDGTSQNVLMLRIANQGQTDIALDESKTSILLSFDAGPETSHLWELATPDQVGEFFLPGKLDSSGVDLDWGNSTWKVTQQGTPPTWKLTPEAGNSALPVDAAIEIPISNIVTGHATGRALLHVQVQGLSGYSDQTFAVEIQKSPLYYRNGNIDFSGSSPGVSFSETWGRKLILDGFYKEIGIQESTFYFRTNDNFAFYKGGLPSSTSMDPGTGGTAVMVIKGDKVGIGTTTPACPLQVYTPQGGPGVDQTDGNVDLAMCIDGQGGHLLTQSNHPLHFRTNSAVNGTPQLTLTTDGKLGIGTTTPSAALDVQGSGTISGKLGIGTTSPSAALDVQGDVAISSAVQFSATNGPKLNLWSTAFTIGIQSYTTYFRSASNFAFYIGGTHSDGNLDSGGGKPAMVIAGDNVGIGTTTPADTLHVKGSLRVEGNINYSDGHQPMMVKRYIVDSGKNPGEYATEWPTSEWIGCVVGHGNAGAGSAPVLLRADNRGDYVVIEYDIGNDHTMGVSLLLIRKAICAGPYTD